MTSLPKLKTPVYFLEIPSTGEKIKYRPFLVKEEKMLMIAMQEQDTDVIISTIKDMLHNCTFGELNIDSLTSYDIEWLLLNIRIKSKGSEIDLEYICNGKIKTESEETRDCKNIIKVTCDLNNAKLSVDPKELKKLQKIMVESNIGIMLKTPTFNDMYKINSIINNAKTEESQAKIVYDVIPLFIDYVFEGDKIYSEFSTEEITEWIENLEDEQYKKINKFFKSIPKIKIDLDLECDVCGNKESVTLEGLQSFLV